MSFSHPAISSLTLALPPARKVPGKQTNCLQESRENTVQKDASHTDDLSETPQERFVLPVHGVADFLSMRGAKSTVLVLSPTGDDGSTASVMLARSMAELGRSVVLVDMTVSGCPTRLMAAEPDLPGMADLLFGETAFGETIHNDRLSNAHIVPQGLSPVLPSGKITERLMMIVGALSDTYDTVLLEFGSADISGVLRLMKYVDAEIVLSLPVADDERADEALLELATLGYNDIMTMSEQSSRERSAA